MNIYINIYSETERERGRASEREITNGRNSPVCIRTVRLKKLLRCIRNPETKKKTMKLIVSTKLGIRKVSSISPCFSFYSLFEFSLATLVFINSS